jgi:hypothetical protein
MPDVSRRAALGAGAGLLLGAMALPACAQQIAAATPPKFRVQPLSFNPEKISTCRPRRSQVITASTMRPQ